MVQEIANRLGRVMNGAANARQEAKRKNKIYLESTTTNKLLTGNITLAIYVITST